jgi:molybdenum cofactor cytidylyltransferase
VLHTLNNSLELLTLRGWNPQHNEAKPEVIVVARKPRTDFSLEGSFGNPQEYKFHWKQVSHPQPLSETIWSGLSDVSDTVKGICFIPGDQVGLEADVLANFTRFFLENSPDFLLPEACGVIGSPVFFDVRYIPELLALQGEQGGKRVLECYRERWTMYPVSEEFFLDIDTREEYEKYRPRFMV